MIPLTAGSSLSLISSLFLSRATSFPLLLLIGGTVRDETVRREAVNHGRRKEMSEWEKRTVAWRRDMMAGLTSLSFPAVPSHCSCSCSYVGSHLVAIEIPNEEAVGHLPISKSIQDKEMDGRKWHSLSFLSSFLLSFVSSLYPVNPISCPSISISISLFSGMDKWLTGENGHSFPFPFSISFPFLFYLPLPSRLPVLELICKRKRIGKRRGR